MQEQWSEQVHSAEDEQKEWSELLTLLDGVSIDQLRTDVAALRATHSELVTAVDELDAKALLAKQGCDEVAADAGVGRELAGDVEAIGKLLLRAQQDVTAARRDSTALTGTAEHAGGALQQLAGSLSGVPEAEEYVAAAEGELARVSELATMLTLTQEFLTAAQDRVHRDIAPLLSATLRDWLPSVTNGRYIEATVDPATLHVKVRGASSRNWRDADLLSFGTAEQVYLLLRVALAQHLAVTGETCPLLLDDVTVQADVERTRGILDLLLRLSEHRQIVLFAQEPSVTEWAREHLVGADRHALRELARLTTD